MVDMYVWALFYLAHYRNKPGQVNRTRVSLTRIVGFGPGAAYSLPIFFSPSTADRMTDTMLTITAPQNAAQKPST